jgi:chemotaxis methyl-accepting protein methylase
LSDARPPYTLPLAHGELSAGDAQELQALKALIQRELGFHSEGYKEHCLRRRIAVRMRACGVHTYAEYGRLLAAQPDEHRRLLDAITINVSKFYRNPEVWRVLERAVVPELFAQRARPVRIWSAGCAAGEEPYTIAMMLLEHADREGRARDLLKFQVVGSDIDAHSLEQAARARYSPFAFTDIEDAVRQRRFQPPDYVQVNDDVRKMVTFRRTDLINDEFEAGQSLIICRNVIIYFERELQERLFMKFHDALAPGGVLVLGKVESLLGRAAGLFRPLSQRERVFTRT